MKAIDVLRANIVDLACFSKKNKRIVGIGWHSSIDGYAAAGAFSVCCDAGSS
jgi:hypothetical protein